MINGVIVINKSKGPTSHDVVGRLRRITGTGRIGHAGTLDPMAEGVLICCVGRATRIVPYLSGLVKCYTGEIVLGAASNTYDATGEITPVADPSGIGEDDLLREMHKLMGFLKQAAPAYSAVKVKGRKLYEYARKGQEVPEKIRDVWVERFDLVRYLPPRLIFSARVGSGTYIRALAHSLGQALGCGAYLSSLCRTAIGGFHVENAVPLEILGQDPEGMLPSSVIGIAEALVHLPKIIVSPATADCIARGGFFSAGGHPRIRRPPAHQRPCPDSFIRWQRGALHRPARSCARLFQAPMCISRFRGLGLLKVLGACRTLFGHDIMRMRMGSFASCAAKGHALILRLSVRLM